MLLAADHVFSGYGKVEIVRSVSITVNEGEIVSIIGRNGVGKSTFVKTVMGLLPAHSGRIRFQEQDVTRSKANDRARQGMGYVPQGHGVFPTLTVEENLMMGAQINKKKPNMDLATIYDYFPKLKERKKQKAGTLSGGEQAALAIGRALVGHPELLILDEPSEGIQPSIIHQISEMIRKINHELGITILFVEQHMGMIQELSKRCYAMDKGVIVGEVSGENLHNYDRLKTYLTV